jgi:glycerol dehydrogenase
MIRSLVAPRRYVQGSDALAEAGKFVAPLGKRALVIWGPNVRSLLAEPLAMSLTKSGVEVLSFEFSGESSRNQVNLAVNQGKSTDAKVVIGVGGGKAIDTAKAIAFRLGTPMVSLPTIASNDAPTSACTVYYTDDGVIDGWDIWPANPDMVLVDTRIIADAPVRWLVSGIGDALATWFEAEACYKGRRVAFCGGTPTMTAMALSRLCYETLMEYGLQAKADVENHVVTPALEKVIEANILLSGLGWESGGLATAHTLGNGLTILPGTHHYSHGEKVAFGLATQLCLDEDIPAEQRLEVFDFMVEVGLPVSFAEIGMDNLPPGELMRAAEKLAEPGQLLHNHVFPITAFDLYSAMVAADALGRSRKATAQHQ